MHYFHDVELIWIRLSQSEEIIQLPQNIEKQKEQKYVTCD